MHIKAIFCCLIVLLSTGAWGQAPNSAPCSFYGNMVNIGSASALSINATDWIQWDPATFNFSGYCNGCLLGSAPKPSYIAATGPQHCLDFFYQGSPNALKAGYQQGTGYQIVFGDGHVVKFIAGAMLGASVVSINYVVVQ